MKLSDLTAKALIRKNENDFNLIGKQLEYIDKTLSEISKSINDIELEPITDVRKGDSTNLSINSNLQIELEIRSKIKNYESVTIALRDCSKSVNKVKELLENLTIEISV